MSSEIIAHYRKIKVLLAALAFNAVYVFCLVETLRDVRGQTVWAYYQSNPWLFPKFFIAWMGSPLILFMFLLPVKRILLEGGKAVWIENGNIVVLRKSIFAFLAGTL